MTPMDSQTLKEQLVALADALGHKALTANGFAVYWRALKEFPMHEVVDCLDAWVKRNTKFPAPAQLFDQLNAARTERIEHESKVEKARERGEAEALFRRSDAGSKAIRDALRHCMTTRNADPKFWAKRIVAKHQSGDVVAPYALASAMQALRVTSIPEPIVERDWSMEA